MRKLDPAAFMSYVRLDDDYEEGRLSELRQRLSGEVKIQTGEDFPIFQDRNNILWGQNWQDRIDKSLGESTFLVCILTPSFFKSPACRKEVERFLERERKLGRDDLILPLYYVECVDFKDQKQVEKDKIAKLLFSRQYVDWRDLRFEPMAGAEAGRALAKMASQIRDAMSRPSHSGKPQSQKKPTKKRRRKKPTPAGPSPILAIDARTKIKKLEVTPTQKSEPVLMVVDGTGRGQYSTIEEAVSAAPAGARILIRPGTYEQSLVVDKPLELIGDGDASQIILHNRAETVINFQTTIGRISNITIRRENTPKDTDVAPVAAEEISQGRLILENCVLVGQGVDLISVRAGADPQITANKIVSESSNTGTGVVIYDSKALIEENEIIVRQDFGVYARGTLGTVIRQNRIQSKLAGITVCGQSKITVDGNDISQCFRGLDISEGSDVAVTRNRIHECMFGIFLDRARAEVESNQFRGGSTGAELVRQSSATLKLNEFSGNSDFAVIASKSSSVAAEGNTFLDNGGEMKLDEDDPQRD